MDSSSWPQHYLTVAFFDEDERILSDPEPKFAAQRRRQSDGSTLTDRNNCCHAA